MIPLLFIILITCTGVFISYSISEEITWFTFYTGGIAGLLVSAVILEIYNKSRKKREEAKERERPKNY